MLIRCHGHSQFLLEDKNGQRVLTDPFDARTGFPMHEVRADLVTVSHAHGDHSFVQKVTGSPTVISEAGDRFPLPDVRVRAIPSFHDGVRGAERGQNLMMLIEMDGLRVLHCGDLGHLPEEEHRAAAGRVDILMVPVGGFFTLDAAGAMEVCRFFAPRVIIPMHYRTAFNASWPTSDLSPFLELCGKEGLVPEHVSILRVTEEDLSQQPRLCVMDIDEGTI